MYFLMLKQTKDRGFTFCLSLFVARAVPLYARKSGAVSVNKGSCAIKQTLVWLHLC